MTTRFFSAAVRAAILSCALLLVTAGARAEEAEVYALTLKDHRFAPDRIEVPQGRKIVLEVSNEDPTPDEFDSHDLRREKVVHGHQRVRIVVGPLDPGEYHFSGEYFEETANGVLVVK